jgi:DNA-binding MarR family transcriptional regulator
MKPRASDISELAFRSFVRTYGLFRNRMDPYFARFGISGAQWGVLRALQRAEDEGLEGLRLTDLGRRLLVRPPSVTSVVDRLERMGLVARTPTAGDLRAKQVTLTPAGRELLARVLEHHPAQIQATLACFDEAEQQALHRLMQKLAAHLESLEVPATAVSAVVEGNAAEQSSSAKGIIDED